MFTRDDAHIANAIYVLNFRSPDNSVRLQQGKAEQAFGGIVNGQSTQTNVPDSFDPAAPRILFNSGTKQVAISQVACQLTLNFPDVGKIKFDDQWEIIRKNVCAFHRGAIAFKGDTSYEMSSLVTQISFLSDSDSSVLNKWLYGKFLKRPLAEELASVSVAVGYKRNHWYLNVSAGIYEKREFNIQFSNAQVVQMNMDKLPVTERGVNLQIDVNNRPKFLGSDNVTIDEPETLLGLAHDFSLEQIQVITSDARD